MDIVFKKLPSQVRRAGQWCLSFVVLFFALQVAHAELRFDVFLGYDGTVREAGWFPITCEIANDGVPFEGFIEVSPAAYGNGQTQRMPLELPTGTLKRITIPAFAPSRYQTAWDVRLIDSRGKVRRENLGIRPLRQVGWETKVVGSLPRAASGSIVLRNVKNEQPDIQPASARFQTVMFPDNPLVLEGLDALYLNSEAAANLRAGQVNALLAWLNAGGHLIVAIEQAGDITAFPWLRNIMPCDPKEVVTLTSHRELDEWARAGMSSVTNRVINNPPIRNVQRRRPGSRNQNLPQQVTNAVEVTALGDIALDSMFEGADIRVTAGTIRDGHVIVSSGGTPLVITGNRGLGRVTALMFSPEREPFKSWKNLPLFWTKLVEIPMSLYASTDYYYGYGPSVDGIFGAMIDSRQVHKLPVGWLLVLLLVYLIVIGPFDRIWLKKINKPMLTWITFPCYVLFFSGLIYFIGYKLRAGDSEYNEIHIVDVLRNGDHAEMRGRTYASIYSPANTRYPMQSALKFATLRGEYLANGGGQSSEKLELIHTGDNFKAEVFVPVWTSQLCLSDWWQSGDMPLSVTIKPRGDGWELMVENSSAKNINASQIVIGENIFRVGEIPGGRTTTFQLKNSDGVLLQTFVRNLAGQYQNTLQERQYAFGRRGGGHIDDMADASMVASFLGQMKEFQGGQNFVCPPGLDLSDAVKNGNAILLAWSPDTSPISKPINQFKSRRSATHTLWRVPVKLEPQQ